MNRTRFWNIQMNKRTPTNTHTNARARQVRLHAPPPFSWRGHNEMTNGPLVPEILLSTDSQIIINFRPVT